MSAQLWSRRLNNELKLIKALQSQGELQIEVINLRSSSLATPKHTVLTKSCDILLLWKYLSAALRTRVSVGQIKIQKRKKTFQHFHPYLLWLSGCMEGWSLLWANGRCSLLKMHGWNQTKAAVPVRVTSPVKSSFSQLSSVSCYLCANLRRERLLKLNTENTCKDLAVLPWQKSNII